MVLDWMIPAPAQGAMVIVAMEKDDFCKEATSKLNHFESEICTTIERQFLKTLEGGCTAPIGAFAEVFEDKIRFQGVLFSLDGTEKLEIERTIEISRYKNFGQETALEILENGGKELMEIIKRDLKK